MHLEGGVGGTSRAVIPNLWFCALVSLTSAGVVATTYPMLESL